MICIWEKIIKQWQRYSLNKKMIICICIILSVPIFTLSMIIFNQMTNFETERLSINSTETAKRIEYFSAKNAEVAGVIIKIIQHDKRIAEYIISDTPATTEQLIEFKNTYIRNLESIIISNPNVRNVRIYSNGHIISEIWPVLLSTSRIENYDWYKNINSLNTQMRIDYSERLSRYSESLSGDKLISYYSVLNSGLEDENRAIVEVSFFMSDFFGDMNSVSENDISFFVSGNQIYFSTTDTNLNKWRDICEEAVKNIETNSKESTGVNFFKYQGNLYLASVVRSDKLDGYVVNLVSVSSSQRRLRQSQFMLITLIFILIIVLLVVFNRIATLLLRKIYDTINAIKTLERGGWGVQIESTSEDEIGNLQRYFNRMTLKIEELMEQNIKRSILEKDAQIKALQNQINSHFLYNVLSNIGMMAEIDGNFLISDTVTALARLLRYSMNWQNQMVSIENEIDYVRDYLTLFNMRYDNHINFSNKIPPEIMKLDIPKMTIQPIVENAVKHGLKGDIENSTIYIKAIEENDFISLEITDNGIGIDDETLFILNEKIKGRYPAENGQASGIGLRNVEERLKLYFGDESGLHVFGQKDCYTKVVIRLPKRSERNGKDTHS